MTLLLVLFLSAQERGAQDPDIDAAVRARVTAMTECRLPELWDHAAALEALGAAAAGAIKDGLKSASPQVRLGCAKALLGIGNPEAGEKALRELADSKAPAEARLAALGLLRSSLDDALGPVLQRLAQEDADPRVRIEAARTLWDVAEDRSARERIERFLLSDDKALRDRAALALGEMGYVEGIAKKILARLAGEPTDDGRRATLILRIERLAKEREASSNPFALGHDALVRQKDAEIARLSQELAALRQSQLRGDKGADPLLDWVMARIRENYVDDAELNEVTLRVGAAKGLLRVLDRFSTFMNVDETQQFEDSISGAYTGVGAQISQDRDTGQLIIVRPLYNGPAYRTGLKPQDRILEIDGIETKGKDMVEIMRLLKGTRASHVKLQVMRRGWKEPREFDIVRAEIRMENVRTRLLPCGIAYVRLDQFGERAYDELLERLDALRPEGFQAIVLDLRGNPGGLLSEAVKVVDLFVAEDPRPIVTQRGRIGEKAEMSRNAPPQYLSEPLVVLIDKTSASASEIVAGALQDYDHRAVLVGERTFGKGSVQRIFPVPPDLGGLVGGRSALRLTVQYYYLPSGRCIHTRRDAEGRVVAEGGVTPDVEIAPPSWPLWKANELEQLAEMQELKDYVQRLLDPARAARSTALLLGGDGGDPERYPGFKEFFEKIEGATRCAPADVRLVVRASLWRAYEDAQGRELPADFQDDVQLRRAIAETLKRLGIDPAKEPAYAGIEATVQAPPPAERAEE
ncbi:MAG TPA: hypothetical protein DCM87_15195 [Planctomycetes bacterium]|nr:hypothetical protein [Planctomycetota bacterium]